MSERGEWRPIFARFWDDADVQALDHLAYRVLTTLKGTLPAVGIGVVYPSVLAERCGCSLEEVEEAMRVLEQPKPGKRLGWIVREDRIIWLVNGLRFEHGFSADNTKNHVPFIRRQIDTLGERPIVRRFRKHYAAWFAQTTPRAEPPIVSRKARKGARTDRLSGRVSGRLSRRVSDSLSDHIDGNGDGAVAGSVAGSVADSDHADNGGATACAAPRASAPARNGAAPRPLDRTPDGAAGLSPDALRFVDVFYGAAAADRRADVMRQLVASLTGGAKLRRGTPVRAGSPERLAAACREVIAERASIRDPDKAIVVLMLKLGDVSANSPTERAAAETVQAERRDAAEQAQMARAADEWIAAHPEEAAAIAAQARAEIPGEDGNPIREKGIAMTVRGRIMGRLRDASRARHVGA